MATSAVTPLGLYRDLILSMFSLTFGRLYPKLHLAPTDLSGKVAIVTGANSGIGRQIAIELLKQNATVYLACRSSSRAQEAVSQMLSAAPHSRDRIRCLLLDTSSLDSERDCAAAWKSEGRHIDILVHNAGIGSVPAGQSFSPDGFPIIYATNILGSFLLTFCLESYLSSDARVIFTSSTGQYSGNFSSTFSLETIKNHLELGFHAPSASIKASGDAPDSDVYANTKSMQVAFAKLLQNRWDAAAKASGRPNKRIAHAFSPGFTMTPIFGKITPLAVWKDPMFWVLRTMTILATDVEQGAATAVWLATTDDDSVAGEGKGRMFWERMTRRITRVDLMDTDLLERFWVRWEADAGILWR